VVALLYPLTPEEKRRAISGGHWYCGREVTQLGYHTGGCFTCVSGVCGPHGGCNCQDCHDVDEKQGRNKQSAAYGQRCSRRRDRG
jgi:hypothetical protein